MTPAEVTLVVAASLICAALALAVVVLISIAALIGVLPAIGPDELDRGGGRRTARQRLVLVAAAGRISSARNS